MKKPIIILFLLFASYSSIGAQEKYALLIGIGKYDVSTGWKQIHGDNDVPIVKQMLFSNGFKQDNVSTLINEAATCDAIKTELGLLLKKASANDIIYIQFSGHGQQITDCNGDEEDGLDEAWVPYDAGKEYVQAVYTGERHITDDYIFSYLKELRNKVGSGGKIVVVSDACHSGGGSRGDDDDFIRGTNEVFTIPGVQQKYIKEEISFDWLYVAACKSYQNNFEYKSSNGVYSGLLSYIISTDTRNISETSFSELIDGWKVSMRNMTKYPQTIDNDGRPSLTSDFIF